MKYTYLLSLLILLAISSCSDPVEDRFDGMDKPDQTVWEILENQSAFSGFTNLLIETGMDSVLKRNTAFSVFAVSDDHLPDFSTYSTLEKKRILSNHLSNFVLYSSSMKTAYSLKMLSGKNIFFNKMGESILVNDEGSLLQTDLMATNGVIHESDQLISIKQNLLEFIQDSPDYSYLAEFLNQGTTLLFDSQNSVPIGINEEGQTVYDTIWKQSNAFFENMADLGDEDKRYTMFLAPNTLLDTASSGNFKFGYLANPGSFILDGLYNTEQLPGNFVAVDNFNLVIEDGNYELLGKLSNGYAYAIKGFEGIRIPKKFIWELTDVSDFDSIRYIKSTQYVDIYDQFKEITVSELNGDFTSFKYEKFSGPLNKDYLQIITTAGTSVKVSFKLPSILPGKYKVKLGAQIRRVDGFKFDTYLNEDLFGTGISLNGGEYNWAPSDCGDTYITNEFGNTFTFAISGSNNNYIKGYFDYLEFEPVN